VLLLLLDQVLLLLLEQVLLLLLQQVLQVEEVLLLVVVMLLLLLLQLVALPHQQDHQQELHLLHQDLLHHRQNQNTNPAIQRTKGQGHGLI
jgi:hypothetical protein